MFVPRLVSYTLNIPWWLSRIRGQKVRIISWIYRTALMKTLLYELHARKKAVYTPPSPSRGRVGRGGKAKKHSHFVLVTERPINRQPTNQQTNASSWVAFNTYTDESAVLNSETSAWQIVDKILTICPRIPESYPIQNRKAKKCKYKTNK